MDGRAPGARVAPSGGLASRRGGLGRSPARLRWVLAGARQFAGCALGGCCLAQQTGPWAGRGPARHDFGHTQIDQLAGVGLDTPRVLDAPYGDQLAGSFLDTPNWPVGGLIFWTHPKLTSWLGVCSGGRAGEAAPPGRQDFGHTLFRPG